MKTQPRLHEKRRQLPSCVRKEIREKIEKIASRYGVSKSWVIAVLLADSLKIDLSKEERY